MTDFNEAQHPRETSGKFTDKTHSAPEATLPAEAPAPAGTGARFGRGDFGPYSLKVDGRMDGREGRAWSGELRRGKTVLGHVRQDGNGGDTFTHFTSPEHRAEFTAFVEENWDFPMFPDLSDAPYNPDAVIDEMFEEDDVRRDLRRARGRKTLPVMFREDVAAAEEGGHLTSHRAVTRGVGAESQVAEMLRKSGDLDGALYFDGDSWVPFES